MSTSNAPASPPPLRGRPGGGYATRTGVAAVLAAAVLSGCTTSSGPGGREVTIVAPTFDPPATVRVEEAGGYRIAGTMPPLEVARIANQMQQNGRAVLQPTASIAATCPRVEFHGCVVRTGDRFVIHIDANLPAWASDIFATALFGYAAQMAAGRTPSSAAYLDPPEYLTRAAGTAAGNRTAAIVTYAHVWGGEPPEPYASAARAMLASARALLELHEAAHAAGWGGDHEGALKPVGHLDACIRSMAEANLSLRTMRELCNLDGGAPLRTEEERTRWAAMRAGG